MILSSLYRSHAEICERMANAAKTAEARQRWNDLAAELRHKADVQDRLITITPADTELEKGPASKPMEASQPDDPAPQEPSLAPKDLGFESEVTPSEPVVESACNEGHSSETPSPSNGDSSDHIVRAEVRANEDQMLPTERQSTQADPTTPEDVGTSDLEWDTLIANIRSNKRPNQRD